ncbi:MAG: SMP-30/gluconolactonase/LRE family protein [Micropepsaceae bacterium]
MPRQTKTLCTGIYFGEGPRWYDGRLWFSDFFAHAVKSVSLKGDVRTEFTLDDRPSGLGWMPDGSMLIVSMEKRQVLRRTPAGQMSVHADLNAIATWYCNDMVVDTAGRAYVGNFGFDLDTELTKRGPESVIADHAAAKLALVQTDGTTSIAAIDMHFPNGTVITPDGKTLIIGESLGGCLTAFDIGPNGALTNRREWASLWPRVPDGICLDAEGAVWVANPLAPECFRVSQGGKIIEVIATEQPCYACMLGGEDGKTLFMLTAPSSLPHESGAEPKGKILVTTVDAPHAGRP